jgi:hypothetical protein
MRELALAGVVAVMFGMGSYYGTGEFGAFSLINLVLGWGALLAALAIGARRLRFAGGPQARAVILRGLTGVAVVLVLAVGLERAADRSGFRFDLTFEQSFELSPAIVKKLDEIEGKLGATLYYDPLDPRVRRTRLLLETLAEAADGRMEVRERVLDDHPDEANRFDVGTSNSVVLELGESWIAVERPTEGTLYEALYRLHGKGTGTLVILRGEGEGDPQRSDELGYSGLATALATEGYEVRSLVTAALREVPEGTDAVLAIAPRRRLLPGALDALRRYLDAGGHLVALLEPGAQSGLEELLAEFGIRSPDALVVDPASGPAEQQRVEGLHILAYNYESHAVTQGLDRNRMTYFPGARPLLLRRPSDDARMRRLVLSSHRAWVTEDLSWLERRSGRPEPGGAPRDYQTLVAFGRYPRPGGEARIVVFGDADLASNRYLRALYNLDLVLNAVHWAADQEPEITQRPKIRQTVQFPLPVNNSVRALYGVGLLLPELLLIAGGLVWIRRRSA